MSLLIPEPPLVVLPSLAKEIGLTDAILAQQLYFAGQREPDGWVTRSAADWSRALRGVIAPRSIERIFPKLVEAGWAEAQPEAGKPTSYRVPPAKMADASAKVAPPSCGGSTNKRGEQRDSSPEKPSPGTVAFADWLAHHEKVTEAITLKRGTQAWRKVASMHAARVAEGYSPEELCLAVDGAWADDFRRENGHTGPESVLRPTKVADLIAKGRRARQQAESVSPYDALEDR
jgi:hypothetical protein